MTEDWAWIDAADEPRYTPEEIMRVADWLVREGHAEPGYAEKLRRALTAEGMTARSVGASPED
jgi:hypothetical protein